MHEHRLASDYIKRIIWQRNLAGVALLETQQLRDDVRESPTEILLGFSNPVAFPIHPCKTRPGTQVRVEKAGPMTQSAANISQGRCLREPPTRCHQLQKIAIPPKIALRAKLLGRVRLRRCGHASISPNN